MTKAIAEAAFQNGNTSIAVGQDSILESSKTTHRKMDHNSIERRVVRDTSELNEAQQIREASLNEMKHQISTFEADQKDRVINDSGRANLDRSIDTMFGTRNSKIEGNLGSA